MTGAADTTFRWAWHLLDGLAAAGVRRVVVSPGSRSTPLALGALRHAALAVEVVVDERSAAFFALGLAKAGQEPVALVATSGSAVANWLPAVVEADMGRVPLILLSADRPPELHDCGASQTMDQIGLFGSHVRAFRQLPPAEAGAGWLAALAARAVAASRGPLPGPVHLNVPLREPLVPAGAEPPLAGAGAPQALGATLEPDEASLAALAGILAAGPGAIVVGPDDLGGDFPAAVADLARRLRVPIFADLLSGLRCGPQADARVLAHPDAVARAAPVPAWLLRFGGVPVSKALGEWVGRARGRPQVVVADHPRVADPDGTATHVLRADPGRLCARLQGPAALPNWLDRHTGLDAAAAAAAETACAGAPACEGAVLRELLRRLPAGLSVFLGNSLTVRTAEWFGGRRSAPLRLFGNRGVAGIDGNLSTAFGIAAATGRALAVVGDLTFLHDLNALALGRRCALTVLLLDNGGGGIFEHLAEAALPEFERGWLVPQAVDPLAAARAFGLTCHGADGVGDAVAAVLAGLAAPGSTVVHLTVERTASLARIRAFHAACTPGA